MGVINTEDFIFQVETTWNISEETNNIKTYGMLDNLRAELKSKIFN